MASTTTDSPSRSILRDKSTNASLLPQLRVSEYALKPFISPARTTTRIIRVDSPERDGHSTPRAGQKRKLDALHDCDHLYGAEGAGKMTALSVRSPTPRKEMAGSRDVDMETELENEHPSSTPSSQELDAMQTSTSSIQESKSLSSSLLTSFHPSQEGPVPLEEQFQIHEETSQRTLDNLHETHIPQNPSQPRDEHRSMPPPPPEGSQDSLRMSSFIDFEGGADSGMAEVELRPIQEKEKMDTSDEQEKVETIAVVISEIPDPETVRKSMITQQAELLRTRLRLAAHKVQTNQVNTPFSRLRLPPSSLSGSGSASRPGSISGSPASLSRTRNLAPSPLEVSEKILSRTRSVWIQGRRIAARSVAKRHGLSRVGSLSGGSEFDQRGGNASVGVYGNGNGSGRHQGVAGVQEQAADGLLELRRAVSGS